MKRAKKSFWFLAGILLLLGFCFREDVLASSLTSLPSLSKAGIGEVVSSDSVIDGRYDFTPLIGSETKIRFGSTDGSTWAICSAKTRREPLRNAVPHGGHGRCKGRTLSFATPLARALQSYAEYMKCWRVLL